MCRLMAFIGEPTLLADVVLYPDRSIIKQSYDARERLQDPSLPAHVGFGNLNGDGFGIGWFSADDQRAKDPTPCVFTSVTPAWNNDNLSRLGSKIISPLMFAHVRAAYPGMPVSEQNCHPFSFGRYLWMHNGVIGAFSKVKRSLLETLNDDAYNSIQSFHSDSSISFALFLDHLPDMTSHHPPEVLLKAMQDAIATIVETQKKLGVLDCVSLLNFVVSDGTTLLSSRFVSPYEAKAATLYYAEGAAFNRAKNQHQSEHAGGCMGAACSGASGTQAKAGMSITNESSYEVVHGERGPVIALVASEPITASASDWVAVPKNTCIVITREKGGYLNILRSPIAGAANTDVVAVEQAQKEVSLCLEAMSRGLGTKSRAWIPRPTLTGTLDLPKMPLSPSPANGALLLSPVPVKSDLSASPSFTDMKHTFSDGASLVYDKIKLATDGSGYVFDKPKVFADDPSFPGYALDQQASYELRPVSALSNRPPSSLAMDGHGGELMNLRNHMRLTGHTAPVLCMAVDIKGQLLYSSSSDCSIKAWSIQSNTLVSTVATLTKPVTRLALFDHWLLASTGSKVRVWDTVTLTCVQILFITGECGTIRAINVLPASPASSSSCLRIFLGCQDATVKVFSVDTATWEDTLLEALAPPLVHAASSPSVIDPTATSHQPPSPPASHTHRPLLLNPGLTPVSVAFDNSPACQSELGTGELKGHAGVINALTTWGPYLFSAGGDGMVRVWHLCDLSLCRVLRGHRGSVLCLTICGNMLVSGSRDNTIRVWDLELDMICRRTVTGHKDDVICLDVLVLQHAGAEKSHHSRTDDEKRLGFPKSSSSSTQVVLSGSADGTIRLWSKAFACLSIMSLPIGNYGGPGLKTPFYGSTAAVASPVATAALCLALTGNKVAVGYSDGEIRMWHTEDVHLASLKLAAAEIAEMDPSLLEEMAFMDTMDTAVAKSISNPFAMEDHHDGAGSQEHDTWLELARGPGRPHLARALNSVVRAQSLAPRELAMYSKLLHCPKISIRTPLDTNQQLEQSLREFVRIKTVSSNPLLRDECLKGARFISKLLEGLGAEVKVVQPHDNKNPIVFGRLGRNPNRPTITFYAHYDVQPAAESEWNTDPFELNAVNEYLYGRGTSDNKGPTLAFIYAVQELVQGLDKEEETDSCSEDDREAGAGGNSGKASVSGRGLPLNLAFIFEGEEENGSVGTQETVAQNQHWFEGTDAIIISNTNWIGENKPCLTYGMRGMISLSVVVTGPKRDIHSGNDGGVFNEPMTDLVKILSTLLDSNSNEILIPGFYSGIEPGLIDLAWSSLSTTLEQGEKEGQTLPAEFSVSGYKNSLGVPALTNMAGANTKELLSTRWCRPSLSVVDMRPGISKADVGDPRSANCYRFGPTRFSVVPKTAIGKVSIRFVPKQDALELIQCFRNHVNSEFAKLGSGNNIEVFVEGQGNWWEADQSSKWIQMAAAAVKREWSEEPLYVREGGTMPVASDLERVIKAPAIFIPMGQASDSPHLANERMRRTNLFKGKNVIKEFLKEAMACPDK